MESQQEQQREISQADRNIAVREPQEQPPQPPQVQKRLEFTRIQWIGVPLILLIPILALFQLFGETSSQVVLEGSDLRVVVEYPTRFRYKQINPMEFSVQNLSSSTMPTITVSIDSNYLLKFSTVTFTPSVDEVTDEAFKVYLTDVQPEETRLVTVQLQGEQYWRQTGRIAVQPTEDEPLSTEVSTFIFP